MFLENLSETQTEKDKRIFDEEFKNFLPSEIIDSHIHIYAKPGKPKGKINTGNQNNSLDLQFLEKFGYEDLQAFTKKIFPGIDYRYLLFGNVLNKENINVNNAMVKEIIINKKTNGLFVLRPEDDLKILQSIFEKKIFVGLKPYPSLAKDKNYDNDQDSVEICDFLIEEHLKFANKLGLIIVLHLSKKKRLNDKKNIENIINISKSYPNIKLVLAHAGRSYCVCDIINRIKEISMLDNIFIDTAMINNWEVIEILLENFDNERILFGSDLPLAGLKGKNMCINNQHHFLTYGEYPWSINSKNFNINSFTFFIYEEIREIKKAIDRSGKGKEIVYKIFHKNASDLINSVKKQDL